MTKHSLSNSKTYKIWEAIRHRCTNAKNKYWVHYGGRGIKLSQEWHNFSIFYSDMGECPTKHQIDRIDNNGDYTKGNCRWVLPIINANNKRSNIVLTYDGESHTIAEWSRLLNVNISTLHTRFYRGWTPDRILHG